MSESLLKKDEVAARLGIGISGLDSLMARRIIPYIKLGRRVRFRWSDVEKALEKRTVRARP